MLRSVKDQRSPAEVTVVLQLNQGERKKSAVYPRLNDTVGQVFFLDFLVLFYQEKSTERNFVHFQHYIFKLYKRQKSKVSGFLYFLSFDNYLFYGNV